MHLTRREAVGFSITPTREIMLWKVGDIAKRTGLSVRTLHYYEEIGLLQPSGRTGAGHRVYRPADLARLQAYLAKAMDRASL